MNTVFRFIIFFVTSLWIVWSIIMILGLTEALFLPYALGTWTFNALVGLFFILRYFKNKLMPPGQRS